MFKALSWMLCPSYPIQVKQNPTLFTVLERDGYLGKSLSAATCERAGQHLIGYEYDGEWRMAGMLSGTAHNSSSSSYQPQKFHLKKESAFEAVFH
jgi:hypothetical protein